MNTINKLSAFHLHSSSCVPLYTVRLRITKSENTCEMRKRTCEDSAQCMLINHYSSRSGDHHVEPH
eukprot:909685-Prorocentrum_minimum.AAC.2